MDYEIMMNGLVKVGDHAPEIEAITTMGKFNLNDYKGKWVVLFSHPARIHTSLYKRDDCFCKSK